MLNVNVQDIKKGDEFRDSESPFMGWDAIADAGEHIPSALAVSMASHEIAVRVRMVPDGGLDFRVFPQGHVIEIERAGQENKPLPTKRVSEKTEAEKLYDVGFMAGINAVLDRLSQDQYTGAVAGPNIRQGLANEMRNHFKTEGKI